MRDLIIYEKRKGQYSTCQATQPLIQCCQAGCQDSDIPHNCGTLIGRSNLPAPTVGQVHPLDLRHAEHDVHAATQQ